MVLEHLGVVKSEEDLRTETGTTFLGSDALSVVRAAKNLGFLESSKHNLTFEELVEAINQGFFPIVYLAMRFNPTFPVQIHAVVVIEIDDRSVFTLDPAQGGQVTHTVEAFSGMWGLMRGMTILIG